MRCGAATSIPAAAPAQTSFATNRTKPLTLGARNSTMLLGPPQPTALRAVAVKLYRLRGAKVSKRTCHCRHARGQDGKATALWCYAGQSSLKSTPAGRTHPGGRQPAATHAGGAALLSQLKHRIAYVPCHQGTERAGQSSQCYPSPWQCRSRCTRPQLHQGGWTGMVHQMHVAWPECECHKRTQTAPTLECCHEDRHYKCHKAHRSCHCLRAARSPPG